MLVLFGSLCLEIAPYALKISIFQIQIFRKIEPNHPHISVFFLIVFLSEQYCLNNTKSSFFSFPNHMLLHSFEELNFRELLFIIIALCLETVIDGSFLAKTWWNLAKPYLVLDKPGENTSQTYFPPTISKTINI
jgi:hypothetical protein